MYGVRSYFSEYPESGVKSAAKHTPAEWPEMNTRDKSPPSSLRWAKIQAIASGERR